MQSRGEREEGETSEPCIISEEKRRKCCSKKREECLGATPAWVMLAVDDGGAKRVLMLRHGARVSTAPRLPNCSSRWIESGVSQQLYVYLEHRQSSVSFSIFL